MPLLSECSKPRTRMPCGMRKDEYASLFIGVPPLQNWVAAPP
jgi:hypothetical protein